MIMTDEDYWLRCRGRWRCRICRPLVDCGTRQLSISQVNDFDLSKTLQKRKNLWWSVEQKRINKNNLTFAMFHFSNLSKKYSIKIQIGGVWLVNDNFCNSLHKMSISIKEFSKAWWTEVYNRIIGATVFLDDYSAECLHWEGGLYNLISNGAVTVKGLSPFEVISFIILCTKYFCLRLACMSNIFKILIL